MTTKLATVLTLACGAFLAVAPAPSRAQQPLADVRVVASGAIMVARGDQFTLSCTSGRSAGLQLESEGVRGVGQGETTATGRVRMLPDVPSPSSPPKFEPQQYATFVAVRPQV